MNFMVNGTILLRRVIDRAKYLHSLISFPVPYVYFMHDSDFTFSTRNPEIFWI